VTATIPKPKAKKPEVTDANALEVVSVGIVVADCVARPVLKPGTGQARVG
jgi:hypothetical protein